MTYTQTSPEWQVIIAQQPRWFSPDTMRFWNSKVLWDTLQPVGNDEWLFLSTEDNFDRSKRAYSVHLVSLEKCTLDTLSFQQTSDKDEAYAMLNEYSFELGSRC